MRYRGNLPRGFGDLKGEPLLPEAQFRGPKKNVVFLKAPKNCRTILLGFKSK